VDILERIQVILDNFVRKNINISANRIKLPVELNGLGMFDLQIFLKSQMCSWFGRATRLPVDNWQYDLLSAAPLHDLKLIRPCDISNLQNPITYNFVTAFREFYGMFSVANCNYRNAYIFDNPAFLWGPDYQHTINESSFGHGFYRLHMQLNMLRPGLGCGPPSGVE
jgi:hypothetical protein